MHDRGAERSVLIVLLAVYALARVLQDFPSRVPTLLIVGLHVLPPAAFALVHGRRVYGSRAILIFTVCCLGSGTIFESLSLRTGFPFGHYYFTAVMGPKIFQLPILLALAYLGIGYLAWVLASLILRAAPGSRNAAIVQPIVAACIMTAWDLAMDPVWCNVDRAWVWRDGGIGFGVPLTNFAGWLFTTWIGYQLFALWLRGRAAPPALVTWNRLAVLLYGIAAVGNLLLAIPAALPPAVPEIVTDAAGRHWPMRGVVDACILVSLLVMMPFALLAWIRAAAPPAELSPNPNPARHRSTSVAA